MNTPVTEKAYPVETRWILKSISRIVLVFFIISIFYIFGVYRDMMNVYVIIYAVSIPIYLIKVNLERSNFHYMLEDKYITIKQGIFSKQERHIPYGVVQHIFVKQDIIDRILGIASVAIENASSGAGSQNPDSQKIFGIQFSTRRRDSTELIGSRGNIVSIPGLLKANAELLRGILLQKIKENPTADITSGL